LRLCFALALFWGLYGAPWPVQAATKVDWTHYEGDSSVANPAPITSQGDGVIAITNARLGGKEICSSWHLI
jgi:hypothetical protein